MKNINAKLSTAEQNTYTQALNACGPIIFRVAGYRAARRTVQSFERFADKSTLTTFAGKVVVSARKCGYPFEVLVTWLPRRFRRTQAGK
jgi:hypothetical protein